MAESTEGPRRGQWGKSAMRALNVLTTGPKMWGNMRRIALKKKSSNGEKTA